MISPAPDRHPAASTSIAAPGLAVCRWPAVLLLALSLLVAGCSPDRQENGKKGGSGRGTAVAVTTALCTTRDVPIVLEATGRVEASASVGIRSRINGTLEAIHFNEGQEVNKGDQLFAIDPAPFLAVIKAREAQLAKDRAELANAEKERDRYLPAAKSGYVSQELADQAATKVISLAATVQADQAALDSARLDLRYCSLTAPFSGRAGEIQADVGELVKANADTPLVTINRISPISVAFDLPGDNLAAVQQAMAQAGKPLEVMAALAAGHEGQEGQEGKTVIGTLAFVDNGIDPATGAIRVKADFANTGVELWPGQLVPVTLRLAIRRDAVVAPSRAVQIGQEGTYVYVVRPDSTVAYRPVVAGARSGGETVIEKGLAPGERVVTDGHLQLVDGGRIEDRTGKPANGPAGNQLGSQQDGKRGKP